MDFLGGNDVALMAVPEPRGSALSACSPCGIGAGTDDPGCCGSDKITCRYLSFRTTPDPALPVHSH